MTEQRSGVIVGAVVLLGGLAFLLMKGKKTEASMTNPTPGRGLSNIQWESFVSRVTKSTSETELEGIHDDIDAQYVGKIATQEQYMTLRGLILTRINYLRGQGVELTEMRKWKEGINSSATVPELDAIRVGYTERYTQGVMVKVQYGELEALYSSKKALIVGRGISQKEYDQFVRDINAATTDEALTLVLNRINSKKPPMLEAQYASLYSAYRVRRDQILNKGMLVVKYNAYIQEINTTNTLAEIAEIRTEINSLIQPIQITRAQYDYLVTQLDLRGQVISANTKISITSQPANIHFDVFLNGGYVGRAPLTVQVAPGAHVVSFGDAVETGYVKPAPINVTAIGGQTVSVVGIFSPVTPTVQVTDAKWMNVVTGQYAASLSVPVGISMYPWYLRLWVKNTAGASFSVKIKTLLNNQLLADPLAIIPIGEFPPGVIATPQGNFMTTFLSPESGAVGVELYDFATGKLLGKFPTGAALTISPQLPYIREQLSTIWNDIAGGGNMDPTLNKAIWVYRWGLNLLFSTVSGENQIGSILVGEAVSLFYTGASPTSFTFGSKTYNVSPGWNNLIWGG